MKQFFKEMAHLLLFVFALYVFNIAIKSAYEGIVGFQNGEIWVYTALYLIGVALAVGFFTLQVYGWFHVFVASTRGMKKFNELVAGSYDEVKKTQKDLSEALEEALKTVHHLTALNAEKSEALTMLRAENDLLTNLVFPSKSEAGAIIPKHFDDWALDRFVIQMRAKLAEKRAEGASGWNETNVDTLKRKLQSQAHLGDGRFDAKDVANYAMFIWALGAFPDECAEANEVPSPKLEE